MHGRLIRFAAALSLGLLACICCCAQNRSSTGRAVYVKRFPKGYSLVRYSGSFARELATPADKEGKEVVVLFDDASLPVYALRPSTGEMLELYKVITHFSTDHSVRDLIFAIPLGPYPIRVYEGSFHPEDGFPKRTTNFRGVPGVDAYLNPSARQKAIWQGELPNLAELELQR